LEKDPDTEIVVLPIGINYSNARRYGSSVSVYYGEEISVNKYWQHQATDLNRGAADLTKAVSESLKKLVTHIDDVSNHDKIQACFPESEFLDPHRVNQQINDGSDLKAHSSNETSSFNFLMPLVKANSIIPILIWQWFYPRIKEEEFISTFKFTFGIVLFPLFYFVQAGIINLFFGFKTALIYLTLSFFSIYLLTKSK